MFGRLRPRSLTAFFVILALAVALPLVTLTALAAGWYIESERARLTESANATGRRLAESLDRNLAEMRTVARMLASSPLIDRVDLQGFDALARRAVSIRAASVTLSELDGRQLVNTQADLGQSLPIVPRPELVATILRTRAPLVSNLLTGGVTGRRMIGVYAPVIRDGVIVKIVAATMDLEQLEKLIAEAGVAKPYFAALIDGTGRVIARTPDAPIAESDAPLVPGPETVSFWDRSELSDWTVISGLDKAALEAPLRQSLTLLGTLGAVLLGLGTGIAWLAIRGAGASAERLARAAQAIGRGETVALPPSPICEAELIGQALGAASQMLVAQRAAIEAARSDLEERVAVRGRELETSRTHYRILARNIADVVVMRRLDGDAPHYVSPSIKTMLGLDAEAVTGTTHGIDDRIHEGDLASVRAADSALVAGQTSVTTLFRARRNDGQWIWVESVCTRIAEAAPDEPDVISVLRDVTARQNQTDELRIARDIAELAHAKAESANRAKSDFLAVMSHEIRTPLSTISGFTDLLAETPALDPEQQRYVALIGEASATMLGAIDDMLDVAKVESGDLRLDPRPFRLDRAIEAVVNLARPQAAHQGIALALDLPSGQGESAPETYVLGDERRLRQVVLNILTAVLHSRQGGSVRVAAARRRPGTEGERLDLSVTATGGRGQAGAGAGLGLTIAERLIELMGGRLGTASEDDGLRCEFSVRLPACKASDAAPPERPETPQRCPARLLVAEDHAINQEIVRRMLEWAGHSVDVVGDGARAVAAVQSGRYDLVLMDIQMPVLDGLGATRRIRALQHPCRHIPIIAMTANVLPEQVRSFREAGMDGHVPKPIDRERLCAAIDALLASVIVVTAPVEGVEANSQTPQIFDRSAFDALIDDLGQVSARATLNGFIALLDAAHSEPSSKRVEAATIAVGARRLGFLDLAAAHEHLAEASPEAREAALAHCRVARDLAHRVLDELTEGGRAEAAARVALL